MGCGYVYDKNGKRLEYHDHGLFPTVRLGPSKEIKYDEMEHGVVHDFVAEGNRIPYFDGIQCWKAPSTHDHSGLFSLDSYEYTTEKTK